MEEKTYMVRVRLSDGKKEDKIFPAYSSEDAKSIALGFDNVVAIVRIAVVNPGGGHSEVPL